MICCSHGSIIHVCERRSECKHLQFTLLLRLLPSDRLICLFVPVCPRLSPSAAATNGAAAGASLTLTHGSKREGEEERWEVR